MAVETTKLQIPGAAPYGFRLYGGDGDKLEVARLRVQSKAYEVGLREGDVILGINGRSCQSISHGHASQLLDKTVTSLDLHIVRGASGNEAISAAFEQLGGQLRPPSPQSTPNGPASEEHSTSVTVEAKLGTSELISHISSDAGASGNQPEFHIQKMDQLDFDQRIQGEEVIVYRHVPNLSSYQQPLQVSEIQIPPSGPRQRHPPLDTNATIKPFVPQENIPPLAPYVPPQAPRRGNQEVPRPPPHASRNQQTSSTADFNITQTSATPWVWQPTHVQQVVSKPIAEFELESVPAETDQYETIVAKHSPNLPREGGRESGGRDASSGDDIPLHLIKNLTCAEDIDFNAFKKKKIFADSMFYDDPEHKYPTIQEQIKMARMVAQSLTAPVNVTARGQRMFMKRKEKSSIWSIDNPSYHRDNTGDDLYYNPTPWQSETKKSPNAVQWERKVQIPPAFTKSKNKSIGKVGGSKARVSFGVSDELMRMKGKGGELFARRRAKSEETDENQAPSPSPQLKHFGGSQGNVERPSSASPWSGNMEEDRELHPQSRLKEMIETNRNVCKSPWDTGVDYGLDVTLGFVKPWGNVHAPSQESQNDRGSSTTFIHKQSRGYGPVSFKAPQGFGSTPAFDRGDYGGYSDF